MNSRYFLYIFFPVLVVMFIASYLLFVYKPLKKTVQDKIEQEFINSTTLKSQYLDNELSRMKEGAKAISSRSMIRNKIVDYQSGKIDFKKLKDFTEAKYIEGIKALENCVYARRIVGDSTIVSFGERPIHKRKNCINDTIKRVLTAYAEINDMNLFAGVISPIYSDKTIVGFDFICSENSNILGNVKDSRIDIELYNIIQPSIYVSASEDTLNLVKPKKVYSNNLLSYVIIKSNSIDAYLKFTIPTQILYTELGRFKKQQFAFTIMGSVLIIFVLLLIHRLAKQWYAKKGHYYEVLASERELELVKSRNNFKQLFELVYVGVLDVDKDGFIVDCNKESNRILKVLRENLIGKNIKEPQAVFLKKDGTTMLNEDLASIKALEESKLISNVEMGVRLNENDITWLNLSAIPKLDGNGIIISFIDITDQVEYEKKLVSISLDLKEANATKDKIFSIIAHDLRSPLGGIVNLIDICYNNVLNKDYKKLAKYLSVLQSTTQKSYALLENLLHWTRIQNKTISFSPKTLSLNSIVTDLKELLRSNIEQKNLDLKINIPEKITVFADSFMLETVLRNLLSNAIKYTPEKGSISIFAKENAVEVSISVSDTGKGINAKDLRKLFIIEENFTTLGTNNEAGTGLGLILCKEFVEKHGGIIQIESEEGKGSTFTFNILNEKN